MIYIYKHVLLCGVLIPTIMLIHILFYLCSTVTPETNRGLPSSSGSSSIPADQNISNSATAAALLAMHHHHHHQSLSTSSDSSNIAHYSPFPPPPPHGHPFNHPHHSTIAPNPFTGCLHSLQHPHNDIASMATSPFYFNGLQTHHDYITAAATRLNDQLQLASKAGQQTAAEMANFNDNLMRATRKRTLSPSESAELARFIQQSPVQAAQQAASASFQLLAAAASGSAAVALSNGCHSPPVPNESYGNLAAAATSQHFQQIQAHLMRTSPYFQGKILRQNKYIS